MTDKQSRTDAEQAPETGTAKKKKAVPGKKKSPEESAAALPYEQRSARLEEIVSRLESGELPLEESLALYEEGVALVRACTRELDEAEQKVRILRRTAEGDIRPADFSEPGRRDRMDDRQTEREVCAADAAALARTVLEEDAARVDAFLDGLYRGGQDGRCDRGLDEAVRYSLLAGGKRVRPALTLEFCRLFGGDTAAALPFAAAVEMVHTFSLIHDDLPCMDDDALRRGRPTNHRVFGEAAALLAGDGLALDAFGMLARAGGLSPETRIAAVGVLSDAAGCGGMVRGQVMDMFGETHTLTREELLLLQARKTGALIRAAAQLGVLAAGRPTDGGEMRVAAGYADRIGLAFQIVDDVLDVTATEEQMGKSVGSDAGHNKNTFLSFCTVEQAIAEAERLSREAAELLAGYPGAERLRALAVFLADRKS